jgi:MFS transporter, DHA1 family, inner membrane transport protein
MPVKRLLGPREKRKSSREHETFMGYFTNRTYNLIYLHAAVQAIAMHGGEAFAFIYLIKSGIAVPVVLVCIGLMFASRIILRQAVLPIVKRVGLRRALALAILLEASAYPILSQATGVGPALVAYLALWAFSSSLYWTTYHTYVALLGDNEHRGAQVSVMEFLGTFMGIVAPLLTAFLLSVTTPLIAFGAIGLIMALGSIPILLGPDFKVADEAMVPKETKHLARLMMMSDGLRAGTFHFTWIIALFITLGSSYVAFGGAMAAAGIVGAAAGLVIGRVIDLGHGLHAARIGFGILAVAALARTLGYSVVWIAVLANAAAAIAWPVYNTGFMSRIYKLSKQSPCPLRFTVVAEGGWDMGTAAGCLAAAAITFAGFSFTLPLALALVAIAFGYAVVAQSYRDEEIRSSSDLSSQT